MHWAPGRTSASALVDAVRRAGYDALPATHEAARTVRRREARQALWQLFVAAFCMMQVMMLTAPVYVAAPGEIPPDQLALLRWSAWVLTLPVVVFSCGPFFRGAWAALRQRRIGMDVPVALGMAITFVAGTASTFDPAGRSAASHTSIRSRYSRPSCSPAAGWSAARGTAPPKRWRACFIGCPTRWSGWPTTARRRWWPWRASCPATVRAWPRARPSPATVWCSKDTRRPDESC